MSRIYPYHWKNLFSFSFISNVRHLKSAGRSAPYKFVQVRTSLARGYVEDQSGRVEFVQRKRKECKRRTVSEKETRKRREVGRQVTRDRRRGETGQGERDTVVGRFRQGCWQGEPGLQLQIKKTGAHTSIDTAAIITGRVREKRCESSLLRPFVQLYRRVLNRCTTCKPVSDIKNRPECITCDPRENKVLSQSKLVPSSRNYNQIYMYIYNTIKRAQPAVYNIKSMIRNTMLLKMEFNSKSEILFPQQIFITKIFS